jgi:hypothetical protein
MFFNSVERRDPNRTARIATGDPDMPVTISGRSARCAWPVAGWVDP